MATANNFHSHIGRYWIDQPQSFALASDCFIFLTGGLHLAVSVGWSFMDYNLHFKTCWFIGVVIGCLLAPLLISWQRRRIFIFSPALLAIISAIISVAASSNENVLLVSRYLNGIAIGLTTVSFIQHGSEIASEYHRGFCLSLEQIFLTIGGAIQMFCMSNWNMDFNIFCLQGILCSIFGGLSLLTTFTSIESPIQYLLQGDEPEALRCILRLYRPPIMTNSKQLVFNKLKEYVCSNESMTDMESFWWGLSALARLVVYRSMLSFIISQPITEAFIIGADSTVTGFDDSWPFVLFGFVGIIGVFVGITTIDSIGRKAVSLFSLLCVAGTTIGVGIIFHDPENLINSTQMAIVCSLIMIGQIFGGIFAPSTTVYLGEGFPLKLKCFFIAFSVIVQYVVDLIIVNTFTFTSYNEFIFCISSGLIMCLAVIIFILTMPETRKKTLKEAQEQFTNVLNLKFY